MIVLEGPPETACPDSEFVASPELPLFDEPVSPGFKLPVGALRVLVGFVAATLFAVCRIVVVAGVSPQAQEVKASIWAPVGWTTYVTHAIGLGVGPVSTQNYQ
jgi:hypothetical protein